MTGSPREFILALGHKAKIWVSSWDISFETAGPQVRRSSISKHTNRLPIVMMGSENNSPVLSRLGAVKADREKVEYVISSIKVRSKADVWILASMMFL